jgi:hypothetical protein
MRIGTNVRAGKRRCKTKVKDKIIVGFASTTTFKNTNRNKPCTCGSEIKAKKCCYKLI